jgi:Cu/Zn superoxide dismutase
MEMLVQELHSVSLELEIQGMENSLKIPLNWFSTIGDTQVNTASNEIEDVEYAVCDLVGTAGNSDISGRVWFEKGESSTTVKAVIHGITGNHGFHIHEFGDLSAEDGLATGGHFNPHDKDHAIPDVEDRHVGDMVMRFLELYGDLCCALQTVEIQHLIGCLFRATSTSMMATLHTINTNSVT